MMHCKFLAANFLMVCSVLQLSQLASSAKSKAKAKLKFDPQQTVCWGPGLNPKVVLPVRYFFMQLVDENGNNVTKSVGGEAFEVSVTQPDGNRARVWAQVLDAKDGSYFVRFRPFQSYSALKVSITYNGKHVGKSPFELKGMVYHESCFCPVKRVDKWYEVLGCPNSYPQIKRDLASFSNIDLDKVAKEAVTRFSNRGMHSLCHYRIVDNKIYRQTHGQHVGFKMFSDAILLSITRKVKLPDMEFFVNLGDWPLEKRKQKDNPIPIFSWCGSDDSLDIVMPTYDITEATLEMMSRVTLDMLSVQGNTGPAWKDKKGKGFWRGRDSRQERLDLVMMSREKPDVIDAALTNMFFFPQNEEKYGKIQKSVPFFDFFKYKYQINIDGTVAAYRFPYLLAGDSVVLKQDSEYYEHFYKDLIPYTHYVPFKHDLSDLEDRLNWTKSNDDKAKSIGRKSTEFVRENLMPKDIYCYHVKVLEEFSKLQKYKPKAPDESWELVQQPDDNDSQCDCKRWKKKPSEEL